MSKARHVMCVPCTGMGAGGVASTQVGCGCSDGWRLCRRHSLSVVNAERGRVRTSSACSSARVHLRRPLRFRYRSAVSSPRILLLQLITLLATVLC